MFLEQFNEVHKATFGAEKTPDAIGQPDQGTGWYSKRLPLAKWVRFMSAQRIIMNYIEQFPNLIIFTIVSGLYFPIVSIIGVWGTLLGRIIFIVGYKKSPPLRKPGMMLIMLCNMAMLVSSIISAGYFLVDWNT